MNVTAARIRATGIGAAMLLFVTATATIASAQPAASNDGTVERISIRAKSLEGNLIGDSPDRNVSII